MNEGLIFVSRIFIAFKDTTEQEAHPVLGAPLKDEGPGTTSSIYEAIIRPIINSITGKTINISLKNTTPENNKPLLKASK